MESENKRWGSHASESLPLILRVPLGSPIHLGTLPLLLGKAVGSLVRVPGRAGGVNKAQFPH